MGIYSRYQLRGEPVCARCGTDLDLPLAAGVRTTSKLREAVARLAEGDAEAARCAVEESLRLKRKLLAVVLREFLAADRYRGGSTGSAPTFTKDTGTE